MDRSDHYPPLDLSPLTAKRWVKAALQRSGSDAAKFATHEDETHRMIVETTPWGWIVWAADRWPRDDRPGPASPEEAAAHIFPTAVRVLRPGTAGIARYRAQPRAVLRIATPIGGLAVDTAGAGAAAGVTALAIAAPTIGGVTTAYITAAATIGGGLSWLTWRQAGAYRNVTLDADGTDLIEAAAGALRALNDLDFAAGRTREAVHQLLWSATGRPEDLIETASAAQDLQLLTEALATATRAVTAPTGPSGSTTREALAAAAADHEIAEAILALSATVTALREIAAITSRHLNRPE